MTIKIPLSRPDIDERDIAAVTEVLLTPNLCFGPKLGAFEKAFSERTGMPQAIACSSGTSALHLCVRALGWQEGDEVLTTPFSFIASANCLLFERVKPVFVDIDPTTGNMDLDLMEAALTSKTVGILAVHVFGHPLNAHDLTRFASKHGLSILEDSCEALGASWDGIAAGTMGTMSVFGFYPNKQITTGEGGMILTSDEGLANQCRMMRNQGRDPSGGWLDHHTLGYNYRISDIQCALGISQLAKLDRILELRSRAAALYDRLLADVDGIEVPPRPDHPAKMSWFVYVPRLQGSNPRPRRDRLIEAMAKRGIQCGRYFPPIHLQPFYRELFGYQDGDFPLTEAIADRCIALPFFTGITALQIEAVVSALAEEIKTQK